MGDGEEGRRVGEQRRGTRRTVTAIYLYRHPNRHCWPNGKEQVHYGGRKQLRCCRNLVSVTVANLLKVVTEILPSII